MKIRLITISDVVLGYGSPQIFEFSESLCKVIGSKGLILQPLVPQRRIVDLETSEIDIETISTASHPHSATGRIEYQEKCAKLINKYKPDVLIITNYSLLAVLERLEYRPKKVIHLALEDLDLFVSGRAGQTHLSFLRDKIREAIDIWIFPEMNRAIHDAQLLNIQAKNIYIFYNVSRRLRSDLDLAKNSDRIIYAGTLDIKLSIGGFIFDPEVARFNIDVYGDLQGDSHSKMVMQKKINFLYGSGSQKCNLQWFGQITGKRLDELLPSYGFSVIFWKPVRHALLNAAPNKFFQALSAGVPVISAPHPQMKLLIERYGCGLLIEGWRRKDLLNGLERVQKLMGTSAHEEMKENCSHAVNTELSFQAQMDKWVNRFSVRDW